MSKRLIHSPEFKARVSMEAISGRKTIQEIAADHAIYTILVSRRPSGSGSFSMAPASC
jgi:transposase-like protein